MPQDIAPAPSDIGFLGAEGVLLEPEGTSERIFEPHVRILQSHMTPQCLISHSIVTQQRTGRKEVT